MCKTGIYNIYRADYSQLLDSHKDKKKSENISFKHCGDEFNE